MIFKTFDSKIDKWTSKIGIFGKSFNELGTAVNNAFKSVIDNLDNFDENVGFWESLKNNLFSKQTDKDWLKNSLGEIISKENIDSYIKELDLESAKEKLSKIFNWDTSIKNNETTWEKFFDTCKGGNEYLIDLIKNTDDLSKLTGEDLVKANQQARASALAHNEAIKAQTLSAKAESVVLKGLSIAMNVAANIGLSILISVIGEAFTANKRLLSSAKELGETFLQEQNSIEDYKNRIKTLQNTINDSSSSFDDVTQARKDLMVIQDELIKKYGTEEETVEKITKAINGQSDALDLLTRKQYLHWKNNFNNKDFGTSVSDFFSSRNIEFAFDKLIDLDFSGTWEALTYPTESNIDKMVSSMQHAYYTLQKTGNDALDSLIAKTYNLENNGSNFVLHGNLNDVYETLLGIQELANDFNVSDSFKSSATKLANSMDKTLRSYMESYDIYVLYEKILDSSEDNPYDEQFYLINKAKEKFDEASILGDTDKIKEAADEYAHTLHYAINLATDNWDQDVADYFKSMYPELQQTFGEWEFSLNFEPNTDGLKDKINNALDLIDGTSDGIAAFSVEDIENFNFDTATQEQIDAYGDLSNAADSYSLTLKQLLSLLQAMGLVQSESYQQLVDTFGQENIDKLSTEDIEIAYTIENVGNMTFEDLQAEIEKAKELAEELVISTFEDAWANSFTSEKDEVKKLGDSLLDLAEKGRLTIETFKQTDSTDYFKNLGISAEEAIVKINKLVDESSQLSSMSNQISKMSEALGTKRDDGFVSADTLSDFDAEVRGLDSWDRFQEVLGSTTSSYDECREAANALAAEWINNSDFLAQLTEQNREYYETQLQAMGIENYEEIIAYAQELNSAKEALSQASFDLATATSEEIQALIADGEYTELAEQQIWALILAEQTAQGADLDTADDCQRLLGLAQNAGVTGKAIELLTELMSIYNNLAHGIYGTNSEVLKEITTRAESIKQNILNLLSDNSSETVELKQNIKLSPKTKSSAGSAGKDAGKAFTDALDKELAALDKKMEAGYINFNDYIQSRLSLIENYYRQGKLSADEYYSYLEKHYDTQLSYMDKVVNAVTRRIDKEIDSLGKQKEDIEDYYKLQIESLEKEKTLLEEANKERQRQIDLQKSLYDLERARNQRTKLVYSEDKGMHYVADDQSVRDAQEDVDNARYDIKIAEIDKSISNLEEARDKQTGAIDEMISKLETYKDAWSDVASAYEEEQGNLIASQILGAGWEADILNGRLGILDAFKNQYISIQQAMADAAWKSPAASMMNLQAYASGTNNAKKGLNLVGEDGTEAYFDNHGHVAIVTKPTLIPMEGGEVVKNERDTKKLLDPDNLASVDTIGLADIDGKEAEYTIKVNVETNGEIPDVKGNSLAKAETITLSDGTVLAPVQPGNEMYDMMQRFNSYWGNINKNSEKFAPNSICEHNRQMLETVNQITGNNSTLNNNRNVQPVVTQNITLTCPNVTNNAGVEYIQRELGHLSLMAMQESMKR